MRLKIPKELDEAKLPPELAAQLADIKGMVSRLKPISRLRGHPVYHDGDAWLYVDNDEPTVETCQERPCGACGLHATADGHDPCLACCGHGDSSGAYVQLRSGRTWRPDAGSLNRFLGVLGLVR